MTDDQKQTTENQEQATAENTSVEDAPTTIAPYNDKRKRDEDKRKVEWAFDFAQVNDGIRNFFQSLAGDEEIVESHFEVKRDEAVQAMRVNIDFSVGQGTLMALAAGGDLFSADIHHVGEMEFLSTGTDTRRISLKQRQPKNITSPIRQGFRALADRKDLNWSVAIASDIPTALDIDCGVGPATLDLTGMQIRSVEIDGGVGSVKLTLPSQSDPIRVELDNGVGESYVTIPAGVHGELDIEGGVGQTTLSIPPKIAIRLTVDKGLGSINLPASLIKIKENLWQTEGYELAERRLVIKYDGGIGSFTIHEQEMI